MSYFSLVYSTLDYSASTWDPHLKKNQAKLEMINCRSARFVMNAYNNNSSVTTMLNTLQWPSLETRRENQRLVLMYKIIHGLVAVPSDKLIRSQVQDHQFVDISLQEFFLFSYCPSLELCSQQQHRGIVQGSPLQITQNSTHSIVGISQLRS